MDPYLTWLKIPPERRPPSHYDLLGLEALEADAARIEQASVDRAEFLQRLMYGPDGAIALRVSREIGMAFAVLCDPASKQEYDETLRSAIESGSPTPTEVSPPEAPPDEAKSEVGGPPVVAVPPVEIDPNAITIDQHAGSTTTETEVTSSNAQLVWLVSGGVLAAVLILGLGGMWNRLRSSPAPDVKNGVEVAIVPADVDRTVTTAEDAKQAAPIKQAATARNGAEPSPAKIPAGTSQAVSSPAIPAGGITEIEGRLTGISCRSGELHLLIEREETKGEEAKLVELVSTNFAVVQGAQDYLEGDAVRVGSRPIEAPSPSPKYRLDSDGEIRELTRLERLGEYHSKVEIDKPRPSSSFRKEVLDDQLIQLAHFFPNEGSEVHFHARYAGIDDDSIVVSSGIAEDITARIQIPYENSESVFADLAIDDDVTVVGSFVGPLEDNEVALKFIAISKAGGLAMQINLKDLEKAHPEVNANKSVVRVIVKKADEEVEATGFVVGASIIATNFHAVENSVDVEAELADGAKIVISGVWAVDPDRDIVLLATQQPLPCPALALAKSLPKKGDAVFALGAPPGQAFESRAGTVISVQTNDKFQSEVRFRGGHADLKWLEISARVAADNSGGPLINSAGEVVGINTYLEQADHVNVAVSIDDIREVLARKKPVTPLASLPKRTMEAELKASGAVKPSGATKKTKRDGSSTLGIELPTGKVLDIEELFIKPYKAKSANLKPDTKTDHYRAEFKHPNGKVADVLIARRGILDGIALAKYADGDTAAFGTYAQGILHGILLTWDERGRKVLFGQYRNGREHGFICLFKNGDLWFVQESDRGKTSMSYVFKENQILKSYQADDTADELLAPAIKELAAKKKELQLAATKVKEQVQDVYKDAQKKRAVQKSKAGRASAVKDAAQRDAMNNSAVEGLHRRAMGK